MMIGGGGNGCNRADHGIGITEADSAQFGTGNCDGDFGDSCGYPSSYSLNLWIKQLCLVSVANVDGIFCKLSYLRYTLGM